MPGHYTNTSSIVSNSNISASTLRGILDDLDDATYAVESANVLAMPPGVIVPFAGSSEPVGWLRCYGQAISRASYAALFAVISTQYGVGDGSTTFNLPDLRGRTVIAMDNMGGGTPPNRVTAVEADTLGGVSGAESHTLTTSQIPAHNHQILRPSSNGSGGGTQWWQGNSVTNVTTIYTENNTGGGGAHNNMQPYIALNYIIKT